MSAANVRRIRTFDSAHLADLARSGLDERDATIMRTRSLTPGECEKLVGVCRPAYLIPYFRFDGTPRDFFRTRSTYVEPEPEASRFNGETIVRKPIRYMQPKDSGVQLYIPPGVDWRKELPDPSRPAAPLRPIVICEGEKKSYALCKAGILAVGLGGVSCIYEALPKQKKKKKKKRDDDDAFDDDDVGKAVPDTRPKTLLPELTQLAAGGRVLIIAFDSDRTVKPDVLAAEQRLAIALSMAGALVRIAALTSDGPEKMGYDDLLVSQGVKAAQAVLDAATEFTPRDLVAAIRATERSNHDRHHKIGNALATMLQARGRFIRTDESLIYFDGVSKCPVSLDASDSRALRAFLDDRTDVTAANLEFAITYERLANTATTHGERAKISKFSSWNAATGTLYISQSPSRLFKITANGWSEVDNGTDGVVIDTRGKADDVVYSKLRAKRADFEAMVNTPNFIDGHAITKKQARLLWAIYVLATLFPQAMPTRPTPLFHGIHGSGKTSGYKAFLRTFFGSRGGVRVINPKKLDDLETLLVNNAIAALDNIEGKHEDLRTALATAATGGIMTCRTLYTTKGDSNFTIDCFLGATSINPKTFTSKDIIDRLLYFRVERRDDFIPESELETLIDANRPKVWRWMLDTLPLIIKALTTAKRGVAHEYRMADFARFALATGPVLGYSPQEVSAALAAMNTEKLHFQSEHSSVIPALELYINAKICELNEHGIVTTKKARADLETARAKLCESMTAAQLLNTIKLIKKDFPYTNAQNFGVALQNESAAIGEKIGFTARYDQHEKRWEYTLAPLGGWPTDKQIEAEWRKKL
jgi:hypothetical protein